MSDFEQSTANFPEEESIQPFGSSSAPPEEIKGKAIEMSSNRVAYSICSCLMACRRKNQVKTHDQCIQLVKRRTTYDIRRKVKIVIKILHSMRTCRKRFE